MLIPLRRESSTGPCRFCVGRAMSWHAAIVIAIAIVIVIVIVTVTVIVIVMVIVIVVVTK